MKKGGRFEDLPVWQVAIKLAVAVFELTESGQLRGQGDLGNQLERASLSVSNNIAEGWERGTKQELLTFLYYAKGSCGEVRSMLRFLMAREATSRFEGLEPILSLALDVSRQLGSWIESSKDSKELGPRSQNTETRQASERALRGAEFLDKLREIQLRARELTEPPAEPE